MKEYSNSQVVKCDFCLYIFVVVCWAIDRCTQGY